MWFNCLRHVSETPITVTEMVRRARSRTNVAGMHRWRYIDLEAVSDWKRGTPPDDRFNGARHAKGHLSQQVLRPLARVIDDRWVQRWGLDRTQALLLALRAVVSRVDLDLPDCLPIAHSGLWSAGPARPAFSPHSGVPDDVETLALPSLLSRALLILAIDFESRSKVSLAIYADLLRVLSYIPTPIRDLPRLTGVSKEAISMATRSDRGNGTRGSGAESGCNSGQGRALDAPRAGVASSAQREYCARSRRSTGRDMARMSSAHCASRLKHSAAIPRVTTSASDPGVPGGMAGSGTQGRDAAALSNGAPSGRLSRRLLTRFKPLLG